MTAQREDTQCQYRHYGYQQHPLAAGEESLAPERGLGQIAACENPAVLEFGIASVGLFAISGIEYGIRCEPQCDRSEARQLPDEDIVVAIHERYGRGVAFIVEKELSPECHVITVATERIACHGGIHPKGRVKQVVKLAVPFSAAAEVIDRGVHISESDGRCGVGGEWSCHEVYPLRRYGKYG